MSRFFHRIQAFFRRKFWTNCPKCSRSFGGHEKHHRDHHHALEKKPYRIICGSCVD